MPVIRRPARHLASLLCTALLIACGGGSGGLAEGLAPTPGPGPLPTPVPAAGVAALAQQYVDVVRGDPRFDECLGPETHRCLRGPRTGSGLDRAVHEWMRLHWSAIPEWQSVQEQPFGFERFGLRDYGLRLASGEAIAAFPWYGQGYTPAGGLSAPLAARGSLSGRIALLQFSRQFNADAADPFSELRAAEAAGAVAAIATFDAPDNLINAHNYDSAQPLGRLPTLIVGKQDFRTLQRRHGETVQLQLEGALTAGTARNSIAYLPGRSDRLVVIGTPMNTWLTGGGERAPGAAVLIDLARHLAERQRREGPLPYGVLLLATGAHEVLGYGLERALACIDADRVHAYVHLGAGLVSQGYLELLGSTLERPGLSQTRAMMISENPLLRSLVNRAFGDASLQPYFRLNPGTANPGEAAVAYNLGIPMFSLTGANPFHHTPLDDERQIVKDALPAMAAAYQALVESLLDTDYTALRAGNTEADRQRGENRGLACPSPIAGL